MKWFKMINKSKKLFVLPLLGILFSFHSLAAPKIVESVAAVVNNNVILESDVNDTLKNIKATTDPKNLPDKATLRHQVIERLIEQNLILQEAAKANITVDEDEVTDAIKSIAKENNATIDELRGYLSSVGISYNSYRDKIRDDIIVERTRMSALRQRINISDKEVEDLAKTIAKQPMNNLEVNISHILIAMPENPTKQELDQASNKAKEVMQKIDKGESFAKLAATYSNDSNALKGGEMGWVKINELPSLFEDRLVRSQKNDIIGPLRSGVGFHILKVNNTRAEKTKKINVQEVNANHILIKTNVLVDDKTAKAKLNEIRESIQNGTISFAEAAKTYSEDSGSAQDGGALGWSSPDRYDPSFKNGLLKLKKGEISQPVKSAYGWHLIELVGKRNVDKTELAQKDQAYRLIFNRKFSEELQVWLQEIKGDAYIKIIGENKK